MTKAEAIALLADIHANHRVANRKINHMLGESEGHDNGVLAGINVRSINEVSATGEFVVVGCNDSEHEVWDRADFDAKRAIFNAASVKLGKGATPAAVKAACGIDMGKLVTAKWFFRA